MIDNKREINLEIYLSSIETSISLNYYVIGQLTDYVSIGVYNITSNIGLFNYTIYKLKYLKKTKIV